LTDREIPVHFDDPFSICVPAGTLRVYYTVIAAEPPSHGSGVGTKRGRRALPGSLWFLTQGPRLALDQQRFITILPGRSRQTRTNEFASRWLACR
jgi:hypothetical protein